MTTVSAVFRFCLWIRSSGLVKPCYLLSPKWNPTAIIATTSCSMFILSHKQNRVHHTGGYFSHKPEVWVMLSTLGGNIVQMSARPRNQLGVTGLQAATQKLLFKKYRGARRSRNHILGSGTNLAHSSEGSWESLPYKIRLQSQWYF